MYGLRDVILENSGNVFLAQGIISFIVHFHLPAHSLLYLWKIPLRKADEQTSLATSSVSHDHEFLGV